MSAGIEVKEFKHIPGVNDAEYIKKLEELREIDKGIISTAVAKIKKLSAQQNHNADSDKKVDAIPIEWIVKYMRSIKSGTFADPAWIIKTMLEEWREEQKNEG